jgi:hypothetical protein
MNSRHRILSLLALLAAGAMLSATAACFQNPFSYGTRAGGDVVPEDVTYADDVYPILMMRCAVCHEAGGAAQTTEFVLTGDPARDHASLLPLLVAGDPDNSVLLLVGSGASSHRAGSILVEGSVEHETLARWIEQGATDQ